MDDNPYRSPRISSERGGLSAGAKLAIRAVITVPVMLTALILGFAGAVILIRSLPPAVVDVGIVVPALFVLLIPTSSVLSSAFLLRRLFVALGLQRTNPTAAAHFAPDQAPIRQ